MIDHSRLKYLFTSILAVSGLVCSFGQTEKAEAEIRDIMKQLDVVGLSVAVVKEGDIIYSKAFG